MMDGDYSIIFCRWTRLIGLAGLLAGQAFSMSEEHTHPHPHPEAVRPSNISITSELWNRMDLNFLMEIEGFAAETDGVSESDLTLATVELTVQADITEGVGGHLGLLWEEDVTEEQLLDEAYLVFEAGETASRYMKAGRMYLPFGNFESVFISDPLTLEMGEIRETAVRMGYAADGLDLTAGVFNGDFERDGADNVINDLFAAVSLAPCENVTLGIYWISDLLETDGFEEFVHSSTNVGYVYESVGGAGAYLTAQLGVVAVRAEYMAALETVDLPSGGIRPVSYHIEASMPLNEKLAAGVKLEGSDDFYGEYNQDKRADLQAGGVVSYAVNNNLTISGEYLRAEGLDEDVADDRVTVQAALVL